MRTDGLRQVGFTTLTFCKGTFSLWTTCMDGSCSRSACPGGDEPCEKVACMRSQKLLIVMRERVVISAVALVSARRKSCYFWIQRSGGA